MMREILFRGKDYNGKWRYGYLVESDKDDYHCFVISYANWDETDTGWDFMETEIHQVIPETVGQYTGLKDKNGVRIFEGDICSYYTPEYRDGERFYESKWETGKVSMDYRGVVFGGWQYSTPFGGIVSMYELRGNIHENPELLEAVN
jgi:uncharacterized phage protein (TIGR01671 family)